MLRVHATRSISYLYLYRLLYKSVRYRVFAVAFFPKKEMVTVELIGPEIIRKRAKCLKVKKRASPDISDAGVVKDLSARQKGSYLPEE